jgi:two-component system chemotaxis response regulator CheB
MKTSGPPLAGPPFPGAVFDVVVLAASAGGLRAISEVLRLLPASFPAALLVVQHMAPHHDSLLAAILGRRTALHVEDAAAGVMVRPGVLYVAAPNWHLELATNRSLALTQTPLVHYVRPSADVLFKSAALCCGERVLAVVLSGTGSDGNMGVNAIKQGGGTVLVQDPATAEFAGMPQAAVDTGCFDLILPLADIAAALCRLVIATPA